MTKIHNLGFPRIGANRELKFAVEKYWQNESSLEELLIVSNQISHENIELQANLDFVPVGDFSLYDHVLDHSFLLGNIASRFIRDNEASMDSYFRAARGRAPADGACCNTAAGEMTKWFDTNYHFIVPEVSTDTRFTLNADALIKNIQQVRSQGYEVKPVLLGPLSYLYLSKAKDDIDPLSLLEPLITVYSELLDKLARVGVDWVQMDEPVLVLELSEKWKLAYRYAYKCFDHSSPKLLLTTYFGDLGDNLELATQLPVAGLHIDAVRGRDSVADVLDALPNDKVLSLGVIDGRNIWKSDLNKILDWVEPIALKRQNQLWLAPSCSLLHVPVDLDVEQHIESDIKQWLAFAKQKLQELTILGKALKKGRQSVAVELADNAEAIALRKGSSRVHNPVVQHRMQNVSSADYERQSTYDVRREKQDIRFNLPRFPTTTIGSFPQTKEIRRARRDFKRGELSEAEYKCFIESQIDDCVQRQEELDLDVFVHGEAERNDMVEYFGEQLDGFVFSQFGWVQSYGSRCVKPPIIFGDVSRPKVMTVEWTRYAQSLTDKPMKGMLTGPVTILNWSFVRDDQPRSDTCKQIALAIRDEVQDLQASGIRMIQIDEAALREGLPLKQSDWDEYLQWAVDAFRLCANGVEDDTQIHTHMCYSEFNDIIESIARLDADVITIETSRSNMELLDAFDSFSYPNDIGPGVYDIHSPNIPSVEDMVALLQKAAEKLPVKQLWVNPDCGLKTRRWEEVIPALENMVAAAKQLRTLFN